MPIKKLIAGVCVISLSACSASGMSMGLGAGVTIAGGALLVNQQEDPGCEPLERATTGCLRSAGAEASNALTTVAGLTLVTFGVLLMGLGAWGAAEEKSAPAGPGLALVPAKPATNAAPGQTPPTAIASPAAAALATAAPKEEPGEARSSAISRTDASPAASSAAAASPAALAVASPAVPMTAEQRQLAQQAQQQKLAAHVQLAAHANRCDAAVYLLHRLRALDEPRALALVQSDAEVARCTSAKQASLGR